MFTKKTSERLRKKNRCKELLNLYKEGIITVDRYNEIRKMEDIHYVEVFQDSLELNYLCREVGLTIPQYKALKIITWMT